MIQVFASNPAFLDARKEAENYFLNYCKRKKIFMAWPFTRLSSGQHCEKDSFLRYSNKHCGL